jgi:5-oxopent-3-ene-1,2,5-tricarboxylate decarboxylase/2-hydroxyhepta-2,4-diene-1,7-dioate isomerase
MKRARIAYSGRILDAAGAAGDLLRLEDGRTVSGSDVVWLPPCRPRTIAALGLNYSDHAKELSFKAPAEPLVFLKGPNALVGHRGTSRCPADAKQMHYECELAAVIGKTARNVRRGDAYEYVRGYTVANDYAIREYLENYYRPNLRAKNRDGLTVVGPWMVDAADIADPMNLSLRTTVNGKLVQQGNTKDAIFDIPAIIEYMTSFMTLYPGDLLLSGTPDGIVFLKPGDIVVSEIENIGCLENRVVGDEEFLGAGE